MLELSITVLHGIPGYLQCCGRAGCPAGGSSFPSCAMVLFAWNKG